MRDAPYANPDGYPGRFIPDGKLRFSWRQGAVRGTTYLREMNWRLATGQVDRRAFPAPMIAELIALYDGGIYYVDEQIGRLLESLARLDLDENTVVIVTADHGEAFLEHRFFLHQELQHELIQVPLIVHVPGSELRGSVERTVHLEDVARRSCRWQV